MRVVGARIISTAASYGLSGRERDAIRFRAAHSTPQANAATTAPANGIAFSTAIASQICESALPAIGTWRE